MPTKISQINLSGILYDVNVDYYNAKGNPVELSSDSSWSLWTDQEKKKELNDLINQAIKISGEIDLSKCQVIHLNKEGIQFDNKGYTCAEKVQNIWNRAEQILCNHHEENETSVTIPLSGIDAESTPPVKSNPNSVTTSTSPANAPTPSSINTLDQDTTTTITLELTKQEPSQEVNAAIGFQPKPYTWKDTIVDLTAKVCTFFQSSSTELSEGWDPNNIFEIKQALKGLKSDDKSSLEKLVDAVHTHCITKKELSFKAFMEALNKCAETTKLEDEKAQQFYRLLTELLVEKLKTHSVKEIPVSERKKLFETFKNLKPLGEATCKSTHNPHPFSPISFTLLN